MKKQLVTLLVLLLASISAFAQTSGKCGDNLKWSYNKRTGELTITGSGYFKNYYHLLGKTRPWEKFVNDIKIISLPSGLTRIGAEAFRNCKSLTSVVIPSSVTDIGSEAFYGCSQLNSISLGDRLSSIGSNCFERCSSLKSICIPRNVIRIGSDVFNDCSSLTSISVEPGNLNFDSRNNCNAIIETATNKLLYGCKNTIIPDDIVGIGDDAFHGCNMVTITLPDAVTSIENGAFFNCAKLGFINIPNRVTTIGDFAFCCCRSLNDITIPSSVTSIGNQTFSMSGLFTITIPSSVTRMGENVFLDCKLLKSVTLPTGLKEKVGLYKIPSTAQVTFKNVNKNETTPISAPASNPSQPPLLAMIDGSLQFTDASKNNRIDAGEQCSVKFQVKNSGKGPAIGCEARVRLAGSTSGVSVNTVKLPTIAVGKTCDVSIPITSNINTTDGNVTMSIEVYEPNGWGVAPFDLTVATKAYEQPYLQVVDYNVASASGKIRKMEPFTLTFNLQNTKYGDAENVSVKVKLPTNVFVMDGSAEVTFPLIKSGEAKPVTLVLAANNNYSTTDIPVYIDVKEKFGKFAENKQLNLALNAVASGSVTITAKDEPQRERKQIELALMSADVDRNIPVANANNDNTFVLIIANETYRNVAPVQFAVHDGEIFRQYCEQTLGITAKNRIKTYMNATLSDMLLGIEWLKTALSIAPDARAIVYYTGHGIPDEAGKSAYLLPTDGNSTNLRTAYSVDELYNELGATNHSVTVFLDACFSGAKRDGNMLASAKGVAIKTKAGTPQGKTVVFSAATGDETAGFYQQQQHGMFTYWLLKNLQQTEGDVTYEQLSNYLLQHVRQSSFDENGKLQTPTVMAGTDASDWKSWTLK